jgi:pimeloyl-ACP methyl ester carboxylesterase
VAVLVDLVTTRTADGVLLHGVVAGSSAHSGVLAVHGAWGNFYGTPVAELLSTGPDRGLTVLSTNLRGHDLGSLGDSERCIGFLRDRFEQAPLDLDASAGLLCERVDRFAVVAHSYGCHRVVHWQDGRAGFRPSAVVLLSPAPHLRRVQELFVDGDVEVHFLRAEEAVAAGEPERLIVLSSRAEVPMVAEAATVLSTWGWDFEEETVAALGRLALPVLVVSGRREPASYRAYAERVAEAAPGGELLVLDDNHYYSRDRTAMARIVTDWVGSRVAVGPEPG